ncbi:UvrB/UvrC motif-containing protein [Candidatus Fermentibacteria bacterium]|nr:UvrB/UvrC motif-containing protein [Candidatus Fermentibacteria bacterium]
MDHPCDACGNRPAEIRVTEVARGRVEERMLCRACAAKLGVDSGSHAVFSVSKLVAGMGDQAAPNGLERVDAVSCQSCGLRYAEFRDSGKLGCPECYRAFSKDLAVLIRRLHGALRHSGRGPGERSAEQAIRLELASLRNQLAEAVAKEAYEGAARLRDRIRELKTPGTDSEEEIP